MRAAGNDAGIGGPGGASPEGPSRSWPPRRWSVCLRSSTDVLEGGPTPTVDPYDERPDHSRASYRVIVNAVRTAASAAQRRQEVVYNFAGRTSRWHRKVKWAAIAPAWRICWQNWWSRWARLNYGWMSLLKETSHRHERFSKTIRPGFSGSRAHCCSARQNYTWSQCSAPTKRTTCIRSPFRCGRF